MGDDLQVVLQAIIDIDKSGKNIQTQLSTLKQKLPNLELNIDANFKLDEMLKQFDKLRKTFSEVKLNGNTIQQMTVLQDAVGKTIKVVQNLNKETGKLESTKITSTVDLGKQNDALEKQANLYQKIKSSLDSLPNQFKGNNTTQDLYSMLDTSEDIGDLKALESLTKDYYNECINLERQYQSAKKANNQDSINAFKAEQEKQDFIYQQNLKILRIKEQIRVASATKGLNIDSEDSNGNSINSNMIALESQLNDLTKNGVILNKEKKQQIIETSDKLQQSIKYNIDNLSIIAQQESLYKKININLDKLNAVKSKDTNVNNLINSWKTLEESIKNGKPIQEAKIEMNGLEESTKKATASTNRLGISFKNLVRYSLFYDSISMLKQAFRAIVTETKALDDSLLEVNKIINLSDSEMKEFIKTSYSMGDSISRTGRDMIDATANMIKAGVDNLDEAMQYGKIALSMKNVGEDMTDVEANANILISAMKGFGNESVAFAERTLNILNEVSNTSAVTFSDLAEGFSRTSAVFSQAGVSIEQTAGLITGANEVIQNIEKSSSGLLIISQRLRQVTSAFEEDPENLSRLDGALQRIAGIDIQDSTGQLRDTYSILTDIAKVYPTLTKNEKSYLGEIIAGKRQISVFESLIGNWKKVEQATASANNSAGSYLKEQEAYFESISGHLARLESSWQSLATKSLDSGLVKTTIDMATSIIKLIDAVGGLQVVLGGLALAFVLVNKSAVSGWIIGLIEQMIALKTAITATTGATIALSLAQKMLIGGAIVAGVMAVGYGINYIANSSNRAKEAVNTLSSELETLQSNGDNVNSLSKEYDELKSKLNKTSEELEKYYGIQNQLKELIPDLNGYINEQGNFIISEKENVGSLTQAYEDLIAIKRKEQADATKESSKFTTTEFDKEKERLEDLIKYNNLREEYSSNGLSREDEKTYLSLHNKLDAPLINVQDEIAKTQDSMNNLSKTMRTVIKSMAQGSDEWANLTEEDADRVSKALSEIDDSTKLFNLEIGLRKGTISGSEFIDMMMSIPQAGEKAKTGIDEIGKSIKSLDETITSFSGKQDLVNSIKAELADNNQLSLDSIQELIKSYPQLENVLTSYLAGLSSTLDVMAELNTAYQADANNFKDSIITKQAYSEEFYNNTANIGGQLVKVFNDSYNIDLSNCKSLAEAKIKVETETVKSIATLWAKYYDTEKGDFSDEYYNSRPQEYDTKASRELNSALSSHKNLLDERISALNEIARQGVLLPNFDNKSSSSGATKSSSSGSTEDKWLKEFQANYDKLQYEREKDLISTQHYYDNLKYLNDKYFAGRGNYVEQFRQYDTELFNLQKELAEQHITNVIDSYEKANKKIADSVTQLDLQQKLTGENSEEYLAIEKQKYNAIIQQETLLQNKIAELQSIATESAKAEVESLIDTYYDAVSSRYDIIKNLQDIDIQNLQSQKDAITSIHDYTMDMIEEELNAKKESYQQEIDDITKVFNAKKKALQDEESTRDYNKGLTEKTYVVADLENQLAIIKNDETAIAKRKELEKQLADAKEDLAEYQHDHSIELAENALDTELQLQTDALQSEIDALDKTLSNEVKMRELADKRIAKSGDKLYNELIGYSEEYGKITKDEITNAWDNATTSINGYSTAQEGLLDVLKLVTAELSKIEKSSISDYATNSGLSTATVSETKATMQANSAKWLTSDTATREKLAEENQKLGKAMGWYYDSSTGIWYFDKDKKQRVYHSGGIVGGNSYATKSTEELAKLLKGEIVLTELQAQKAVDMINNNTNNSQVISPTIVFNIEGEATHSTIDLIKQNAKEVANIVATEFNKSKANTGWKKPINAF